MNPKDKEKLEKSKIIVRDVVARLKSLKKSPKIFIKIARNLGDSLHGTPVMRHYKTKYPDCAIAFLTESRYKLAHSLNTDIDILEGLPDDLHPHVRIELKKYIDERVQDIDYCLCPAVFPFGEVWATHKWSHPLINHQYYANSLIKIDEMEGDKRLHAPVSEEDLKYAGRLISDDKFIAIEYHSYSHPTAWGSKEFSVFTTLARESGYKVLALAGKNESLIPGAIDGRGIDWRKTIAILSKCKAFIGIGSGITMLAGCADPIPNIIEIGVSESIAMKDMGYSSTARRVNGNSKPAEILAIIKGL